MSGETALVPIDEWKVDFYGDEITTALVNVESQTQIYVPVLCETIPFRVLVGQLFPLRSQQSCQ